MVIVSFFSIIYRAGNFLWFLFGTQPLPVGRHPMHMTFAEEHVAVIIAPDQGGERVDAQAASDVIEVAAVFC